MPSLSIAPASTTQRFLLHHRSLLQVLRAKRRARPPVWQLCIAASRSLSWLIVFALVGSQLVCLVRSTVQYPQYNLYGRDPRLGPAPIDGKNDEPYSDRSIVCVLQGRLYKPMQLNQALASHKTHTVDTTGAAISGYRTVDRHDIELHDEIAQRYTIACGAIAAMLDNIILSCKTLGYNVVDRSDNLRVVNGIFSNTTQQIGSSLPVLIMPFWDNAIFARYAMPAVDGGACVFALTGQFDTRESTRAKFHAMDRTARDARTTQWLGLNESKVFPWRNGWMEDEATGMRWFADMGTSRSPSEDEYMIPRRHFDLLHNRELNCSTQPPQCTNVPQPEWWGAKFSSTDDQVWYNSAVVSNGTHFGIFIYEALHTRTVRSLYDVAMLISNTTVVLLLWRWLIAGIALVNAYRYGYSPKFHSAGLGVLSSTLSFELLPILLLPRVRDAFAAFFTAGCKFEGEQMVFSDAWFAIYPGIAETMLFFYSVLNLVAKATRRRMSDVLFSPSLAALCLLHFFRQQLAMSGWFEFDGRIATVMSAREYEKLTLLDYITTNAALRLNGNVWSLFGVKLAILSVNLVPLILARRIEAQPWVWNVTKDSTTPSKTTGLAVERALGVRASESAGLGTSPLYDPSPDRLNCYELLRLGYIVVGDTYMISVSDWMMLSAASALRSRRLVSSMRLLAFRLRVSGEEAAVFELESSTPQMLPYLDLTRLGVWEIAAVPVR